MTKKTPHRHADLIAEWIKDTGRIVQFKPADFMGWRDIKFPEETLEWREELEYRFKPEEPKINRFFR